MRLAYADPPYPGKAHLYPENTEVDHAELIARLGEYDGWALSTDERNLAYVLGLCPPGTRVLAWCRSTAPPFNPFPFAAWEPVLCRPGRVAGVPAVRSYVETNAATGRQQRKGLTGQKPAAFCEWVIRCLGAQPGDTLDDIFPGTGIMGDVFDAFSRQLAIFPPVATAKRSHKARANLLRVVAQPLPGITAPERIRERLNSGRT